MNDTQITGQEQGKVEGRQPVGGAVDAGGVSLDLAIQADKEKTETMITRNAVCTSTPFAEDFCFKTVREGDLCDDKIEQKYRKVLDGC